MGASVPSMSQSTAPRRGCARSGATRRARLPSTGPTIPAVSRRTLALVGIGLAAGFLSGVLGIGRGIVIVPLPVALVAYAPKRPVPPSLAAIFFPAAAAAPCHAPPGHVDWPAAALVGPPPAAAGV